MSWQTVLLAVINPLLGAGLIALLRLWNRNKAVEQTLYGQPGEQGLVGRVAELTLEVRKRDHDARGRVQEALAGIEQDLRQLQLAVPRRKGER